MTLTLTIRNMDRLDNGMPAEFVLNRRGAVIGRAATCDWSLPDPRNFISSRHLEVTYRDGAYTVADTSTNGTYLNGATERMTGPRRVEPGDLFLVGMYEIAAELSGAAAVAIERQEEAAAAAAEKQAGWSWDAHGGAPAAAPAADERGGWGASGTAGAADEGWGAPANGDGDAGWGAPSPASQGDAGWGAAPAGTGEWAKPAAAASDGWGPAPSAPAADAAGGWGAPAAPAAPQGGWAASTPSGAGAGWMPPAEGPRLGRETPYAQRGGGPAPSRAADALGGANSWASAASAAPAPSPSVWDAAKAPVQQASAWSSAVGDRPRQARPDDIWGSMENSNVVDWARADFGQPQQRNDDPLGLTPKPAMAALPREMPPVPASAPAEPPAAAGWGAAPAEPAAADGWGSPPAPVAAPAPERHPPTTEPEPSPRSAAAPLAASLAPVEQPRAAPASAGADLAQVAAMLATAAGLEPSLLKEPGPATLERAGQALRRLVSGLVVMVEARARAKSQMGAEQTGLEFDGNNPLKFARAPDQALAQLLNPPERGFMPAERAIEDAYFDLQSHQMATLKAMQGALRATLDRFSPAAIRKRAETGGFMSRLLPGGREATLWATYEKEFSGVAQGSDEAFMDVFAKEFRKAYDEQSRNRRKG